MTQPPALAETPLAALGPGRLVLIVGPSGAGKDTLLKLAHSICADDKSIIFPQRVVTREASEAEDNQQISPDDFEKACASGHFAMHWQAHGHGYGVPRSIDDDVAAGRTVVVNVSRGIVEAARRRYAHVTVVSITAPLEVLSRRLASRARSSDGRLVDRLTRAADGVATPDVVISNVGDAQDHASELVRTIRG